MDGSKGADVGPGSDTPARSYNPCLTKSESPFPGISLLSPLSEEWCSVVEHISSNKLFNVIFILHANFDMKLFSRA